MRVVPPKGPVVACWSAKGGSGTSVVAVTLALLTARSSSKEVLLVDLGDDQPSILGGPQPSGPGVHDWLKADAEPEAFDRLAVERSPGVRLVTRGKDSDAHPPERLVEALLRQETPVVVDCGRPGDELGLAVAGAAALSLLVMRPCFLALRRAAECPLRPTGLVVVDEPGRVLDPRDVAESLGFQKVTRIPWNPAIARAVDAGSLTRVPRSLVRSVRPLAEDIELEQERRRWTRDSGT